MKTVAIWVLALIVIAALAWSGAYLYWHFRVVGALRTLESQPTSSEIQSASDVLNEAGCRGLPVLVGSLNPSKNSVFLTLATTHFAMAVAAPGEPKLYNPKVAERLAEWRIESEDAPAVRQKKCDLIRAWWRENGGQHHQSWRIWSGECYR